MNTHVYIKLTKLGFQHWADWYNSAFDPNDKCKVTTDYLTERADKNGYVEFQLHHFLEVFGAYAYSNSKQHDFFGIDILFKKNEFRELTDFD